MAYSGDTLMVGLLTKVWAGCGESPRGGEVPSDWEQGKLLAPLEAVKGAIWYQTSVRAVAMGEGLSSRGCGCR